MSYFAISILTASAGATTPMCPAAENLATARPRTRYQTRRNHRANLLVGPAVMLEPTGNVIVSRIVMRPVNDPAFRVPFVFPEKFDRIANSQRRDRRCKIDVVSHQQCLP